MKSKSDNQPVYTESDLVYKPKTTKELQDTLTLLNNPDLTNEALKQDLIDFGMKGAQERSRQRMIENGARIFGTPVTGR